MTILAGAGQLIQRHRAISGQRPPRIDSVVPPTRPGTRLFEGEPFELLGGFFGGVQGTGKVYWADGTDYAIATKTECTVVTWGSNSIIATMCDPAAVGNSGYFYVVRDDGTVSEASTQQECLPLTSFNWTFAVGSRPIYKTQSGATVDYTTDNGNDVARVNGLAPGEAAYGRNDDLSPALSEVFVRAEESVANIMAQGAGKVRTVEIAEADDTDRASAHFYDGDTATPDIEFCVGDSGESEHTSAKIAVTNADYYTTEMYWINQSGTVTFKAWADGTVAQFNGEDYWSGAGFGATAIAWACCGCRWSFVDSVTGGTFDHKSLKMWGR